LKQVTFQDHNIGSVKICELSVYRNAPLTDTDGDIDGALEQMSSFADEAARTSADEELYSSSMTGQAGDHLLLKGQDKPPTPPKVSQHPEHASGLGGPIGFIGIGQPICYHFHAARFHLESIHSSLQLGLYTAGRQQQVYSNKAGCR
jgi:hypothetical protein